MIKLFEATKWVRSFRKPTDWGTSYSAASVQFKHVKVEWRRDINRVTYNGVTGISIVLTVVYLLLCVIRQIYFA